MKYFVVVNKMQRVAHRRRWRDAIAVARHVATPGVALVEVVRVRDYSTVNAIVPPWPTGARA